MHTKKYALLNVTKINKHIKTVLHPTKKITQLRSIIINWKCMNGETTNTKTRYKTKTRYETR